MSLGTIWFIYLTQSTSIIPCLFHREGVSNHKSSELFKLCQINIVWKIWNEMNPTELNRKQSIYLYSIHIANPF